jgi:hypothetical protein
MNFLIKRTARFPIELFFLSLPSRNGAGIDERKTLVVCWVAVKSTQCFTKRRTKIQNSVKKFKINQCFE